MSTFIEKTLRSLPEIKLPKGFAGFSLYVFILGVAALMLPPLPGEVNSAALITVGTLAMWRYLWGFTNFVRSLIYRHFVFPRWRRLVEANTNDLLPSKIYFLITTFRIDTETSVRVIKAAIKEAIECGVPVNIVASIVEFSDELLYKQLFASLNPPERVKLDIVRIPGSGKRDALAQGFRAISRDAPPQDAVVAVIDGDTALTPGSILKCTPFFKLRPNVGALTTDELCEVNGTETMREWHDLRFAQRQILMSSIALSKRVMTLTGRMSMFRASIVTSPDFIHHVTNDHLDHWRLGRFKFLTGDDKSSLYWVLKNGYEQIYVPDVVVLTMETPPSENFIKASNQLMFRWFGNMLRTNMRVLQLGPSKMPFFVWWSFLDQRMSMWTSLTGPVFAAMLALQYGVVAFYYYLVWVGFIRGIWALFLLSSRPEVISWRYPFLIYYSQVYGALLKTYVLFRLDRQSWTRQKTKLNRGLSAGQVMWQNTTSTLAHVASVTIFISVIGLASGQMKLPTSLVSFLLMR